MDIELLVAMIDGGLSVDEAAIVETMISEHSGTNPDAAQLVEEIGLAIAIHRRTSRDQS